MTDRPYTDDDPAETWKHRKGDRYYVVRSYPQGNPEDGYWWSRWWDSDALPTIADAKRVGFGVIGSDDFNILAERNGRIAAVLWMNEVIDTDPDTLASWEATR